jgi:hypothetical protein
MLSQKYLNFKLKRTAKLSPEQRSEIAKKAAQSRWKKENQS